MMLLPVLALTGCLAVDPSSDRITAGDLAASFPALAVLDPSTTLGFAPVAGAKRVFQVGELRRIALRLGIATEPATAICVERSTAALDPEWALLAMRRELPDARISIVEISRQPAPGGEVEFPLSGLRRTPGGGLWTGWVRYAGGRRFPVWAKVEVSVPANRVLAVVALKAGHTIEASEIRIEAREGFPQPGVFAGPGDETAGKIARIAIPAGAEIRRQWLQEPKAVERGSRVVVEARAGSAVLKMEAVAEGGGAAGQTIPVRNPASGKRFTARIEGPGRVTVLKGDL